MRTATTPPARRSVTILGALAWISTVQFFVAQFVVSLSWTDPVYSWSERTIILLVMQSVDNSLTVSGKRGRFGRLDPYERARKELFAEGISSSKIYLDPLRPSVEDLVDMITSGVRSSFTYAGASTVAEFHERATVGLQSAAGYEEGKALPVSW